MEELAEDNGIIRFNDELLGILRHFYKERSVIDFIRRFPIFCYPAVRSGTLRLPA